MMAFPFRARLLENLEALSSEAISQIEYLRKIGGEPFLYVSVDELALDHHELCLLLDQYVEIAQISPHAADCILALNDYFDKMSGEQNGHLWTLDALHKSAEWKEVRERAKYIQGLLDMQ